MVKDAEIMLTFKQLITELAKKKNNAPNMAFNSVIDINDKHYKGKEKVLSPPSDDSRIRITNPDKYQKVTFPQIKKIVKEGICYDDPEQRRGDFDPSVVKKMDPHKHYDTHMGNYFKLKFLSDNSRDFREKQQATKELGIARRKMDFWRKHENYDPKVGAEILQKHKKIWAGKTSILKEGKIGKIVAGSMLAAGIVGSKLIPGHPTGLNNLGIEQKPVPKKPLKRTLIRLKQFAAPLLKKEND